MSKKQKVDVMYFDSNFNAVFDEKEVKDGQIEYKDKTFKVDNCIPVTLLKKSLFGRKLSQLYFLRHNSAFPSANMNPSVDTIVNAYPEFKDSKVSPEMLKKLINMKILGNMIKTKKDSGNFVWIIMALIVGIAAMYMLVSFGVITVSPIG